MILVESLQSWRARECLVLQALWKSYFKKWILNLLPNLPSGNSFLDSESLCLVVSTFSPLVRTQDEMRDKVIYSPEVKSSNVKDELLERGRVDRPWLETLTVHRILHRCHRSELINHRLIDFWGRGTTDELLSGRHLSCDQNKTREPSAGSYLKGICCNPSLGNMGPTIEPRYRGGIMVRVLKLSHPQAANRCRWIMERLTSTD